MKILITVLNEDEKYYIKEDFVITPGEYDSIPNPEGLIALKISEMRNAVTNEYIRIQRLEPATVPVVNN